MIGRVVGCLLIATAVVSAQPSPDRARAEVLFTEGTKHFNLREYAAAVAAFKEAYRLVSEPLFLFNIAQAYRLDNDCRTSHAYYKTYLRDAPSGTERAKAEKWLNSLEACARVEPVLLPPAEPMPNPQVSVRVEPVLTAVKSPPSIAIAAKQDRETSTTTIAGIASIAAGGLLIGGGVYFSVVASGAARDVETTCASACEASAVASLDARGRAAGRNATLSFIAGGLGAAIGVGLLVYSRRVDRTVAITPTHGGAFTTAVFRF